MSFSVSLGVKCIVFYFKLDIGVTFLLYEKANRYTRKYCKQEMNLADLYSYTNHRESFKVGKG